MSNEAKIQAKKQRIREHRKFMEKERRKKAIDDALIESWRKTAEDKP